MEEGDPLSKGKREPTSSDEEQPRKSLWWHSEQYVPVSSEEAMIAVLVRWGDKERGMMKNQPGFRLEAIKKKLRQVSGMRLEQALSLRRHHMNLLNPHKTMQALGLGKMEDIRTSAQTFEQAIEEFLMEENVTYLTEEQQKIQFPDQIYLTPDFLLPMPIRLKKFIHNNQGTRQVIEEQTIYWIEAKMFYGASTIPSGTRGAVGSIIPKVKQYVDRFGNGAIIFMHGCGDRFAKELTAMGVTVLTGSGIPSRLMEQVKEHQRTWCARDGLILP